MSIRRAFAGLALVFGLGLVLVLQAQPASTLRVPLLGAETGIVSTGFNRPV